MRKLKHLFCLVLILLTVLTCTMSVCAQGVEYYIEELKMTVSIPSYMTVNTKETSSKLSPEIYLEASGSSMSADLDIRIWMQKSEKTEEFFNLSLLSESALDAYKENLLSNPEYSDCTQGEYGGVIFLDFSAVDIVGETTIYGRESQTIVNGMSIGIMSTSVGDPLTSQELNIIKDVLESVKFDKILSNEPGPGFWAIFVPILIGVVVLAMGFVLVSYFMGKKSREAKLRRKREQERRADYDVLSRANKAENQSGLGGYKTSGAFFEDAFENGEPAKSSIDSNNAGESAVSEVVSGGKQAIKSTGYFFKNLKREIDKSKNQKASKKAKRKKQRRINEDYDIFNDKI